MKISFFGTSEFGLPALEKLKEADFELAGVVTQPDKPAGRKQELILSPVKKWAQENEVSVLQPEKLTPSSELPTSDLFVVASYGLIIPKEVLDIPKYGALNIHPSLLPKYRGASPIQAAILNGDDESGVTIIKMDEEVDHGEIVSSIKYRVSSTKITYQELHDELAELGAELLIKTLPDYIESKVELESQDHNKATFTKLITKDDARIDWAKSAKEIDRMVRAYHEWPVAWTTLDGKRLKIYKSEVRTSVRTDVRTSGQVSVQDDKVLVRTGDGNLEILELQLEGKQKMPAAEFIRGQKDLEGKVLK